MPVRYLSTRGDAARPAFCDILLGGLAPDGGLYLPETYPQIDAQTLDSWRTLPYHELAFEVLRRLIDDIPVDDLRTLCARTWRPEVYCHVREGSRAQDITPVTWLERGKLALLELSNGPTLAFKDMAMQFLGHVFEYELARRGQTLNILGATSGDTGSAAEYALRGKRGVRVFMLSPHGKMSAFQRAQMYSLTDENIFNIAITGLFDQAQDVVKTVSADASFKARHRIGAVNSINWARIAAQVVYYFKGYLAATENSRQQVAFCVPSGNFGNVCAGHIAHQMGLPVARLIVATNENDVLDEFFRTGRYRPRAPEDTFVTSSPSMDISKASNFERFIFDVVGRDAAALKRLWNDGQGFDLAGTPEFARVSADFVFSSGASNHALRLKTIRRICEQYNVLIDPHTADAMHVARQQRDTLPPDVPLLVLETAQPVKFADTLREALGDAPQPPEDLRDLEDRPQKVAILAPDADVVKEYIAQRDVG